MLTAASRPFEVGRFTASIASSGTTSSAVDMGGLHLVGLIMPAAWTAATIGLQASLDGESWRTVHDAEGAAVTIQADANRWIAIDPVSTAGFSMVRLVASAGQAAAREITVIGRAL